MKKVLLLACAVCAALTADAQSLRLQKIYAEGYGDYDEFKYNNEGQLDYRLHYEQWLQNFIYKEYIIYNADGTIKRDEVHQDLVGDMKKYTLVNYCAYTYNDKKQLATRDNYNAGGELTLEWSARITYSYNEQDLLASESCAWSDNLNSPFMRTDYTYDSEGRLARTTSFQKNPFMGNKMQQTGFVDYYYDKKTGKLNYYMNYVTSGGVDSPTNAAWFYWDGDDLDKVELIGQTGDVHDRAVFKYDKSVPASELFIPKSHEFEVESAFDMAHKRLRQEVWIFDEYTNQLVYTHDLVYEYEDMNGVPEGVQNVMAGRNLKLSYSAADKAMNLSNTSYADVRVVDMSGRTVLTTSAHGKVDLSSLPKGNYIVTAQQMAAPAVMQKICIR